MHFSVALAERYTEDNVALLHYFRDNDLDPYPLWFTICRRLEESGELEEFAERVGVEAGELEDTDPGEVWPKLSRREQETLIADAVDYLMQYDPAEVPSNHHMSLIRPQLLPRTTWLVHFSDRAEDVAREGFRYGMDHMDRLGLTTYFKQEAKRFGGYNFAFRLQDAPNHRVYGRDAVIFQSSGILVHHHGDDEQQVIFYGRDVDPRTIILVRREENEFVLESRRTGRVLARGPIQRIGQWIMTNHRQYHHHLYAR